MHIVAPMHKSAPTRPVFENCIGKFSQFGAHSEYTQSQLIALELCLGCCEPPRFGYRKHVIHKDVTNEIKARVHNIPYMMCSAVM